MENFLIFQRLQIGKNCRWIDRLSWSDQKWIQYVENKNVKTYILKHNEELVGYFEQIFSDEDLSCEIAYLGILDEYLEKKYGGYLLTEAIKESFVKINWPNFEMFRFLLHALKRFCKMTMGRSIWYIDLFFN